MNELLFYKKFLQVMNYGNQLNWHERNSGNLSYRLSEEEIKVASPYFKETDEVYELSIELLELAGDVILLTASGQFFMNCYVNELEVIGMIQILEDGKSYKVVYGFENGAKPTSEYPTHLTILQKDKKLNNNRVVYHCHPTNCNALSFVYPKDSYKFSARIWSMATEAAVVVPRGIACLKWMMPGSLEIGLATADLLDEFDIVLWMHHGIFATGDTLDNTFGKVHVVEKAAEVACKVESMKLPEINRIQKSEILELCNTFNIEVNPQIVDEL